MRWQCQCDTLHSACLPLPGIAQSLHNSGFRAVADTVCCPGQLQPLRSDQQLSSDALWHAMRKGSSRALLQSLRHLHDEGARGLQGSLPQVVVLQSLHQQQVASLYYGSAEKVL